MFRKKPKTLSVDELNFLKIEGVNCKGFGVIPKVIMFDRDLTIEAKAIYAYFCSFAGAGSSAFPGLAKILEDLQLPKKRYYLHFNQLVEQGYIKIKKTKTWHTRNTYILVSMPAKLSSPLSPAAPLRKDSITYNSIKAFGYGSIPKFVMQDPELDIKAKGIYAYLVSLAGAGMTAIPSRDKILLDLILAKNTYYKYLDQLIQKNYISIIQNINSTGNFSSNLFVIEELPDSTQGMDNLTKRKKLKRYYASPCLKNDYTCKNGDAEPFSPCLKNDYICKDGDAEPFSPCLKNDYICDDRVSKTTTSIYNINKFKTNNDEEDIGKSHLSLEDRVYADLAAENGIPPSYLKKPELLKASLDQIITIQLDPAEPEIPDYVKHCFTTIKLVLFDLLLSDPDLLAIINEILRYEKNSHDMNHLSLDLILEAFIGEYWTYTKGKKITNAQLHFSKSLANHLKGYILQEEQRKR